MTIRRPPPDPSELTNFPTKSVAPGYPYVRIHRHLRDPEWFCSCGNCRFDPPPGTEGFGTCYLSGHPLGAFIEKFGDLEVVTRNAVDECRIASLIIPDVRLADVTHRRVLGRWGLTAEIGSGDDYLGSQLWAERLWQAGFGGLWYQARHDPRADLHSIALFGKPGVQRDAFVAAGSVPIGDELIDETARVFGLEVLPGTPLP